MNMPPMFSEPHPYDNAYGLSRQLRSDVDELRAALHAEQVQRATEVQELRNEVMSLREVITRERQERMTHTQRLQADMTTESSSRVKALEELRMQHRQNVSKLNEIVQDEIRDRKAMDAMRETREQARESEYQAQGDMLNKRIDASKASYTGTKDDHSTRLNQLNHDMQVVVTFLRKSGASYETLASAKLMSNSIRGQQSPDVYGKPVYSSGYDFRRPYP